MENEQNFKSSDRPLISMQSICKRFGDTLALNNVNFNLYPGEVHALLGGNGAGKSTLMKILMGVHSADQGEMYYKDNNITKSTIKDSLDIGIAMIFQELSILPNCTVSENIMLGKEPQKSGYRIDYKKMNQLSKEFIDKFDFDLNPKSKVGEFGFAKRQICEILKCISSGANVLIMDEPTSALTLEEEEKLFSIISNLKEKGIGIIYISHRMNEIFKIADRITVLKSGENVGTYLSEETSITELSYLMSSKNDNVENISIENKKIEQNKYKKEDKPVLEVINMNTRSKLKNINFELKYGEVLGIAGLVGSGRSTLAKAIFGLISDAKGCVKVEGKNIKLGNKIEAMNAGIGLIPEDRLEEGLVLEHSVEKNNSLLNLSKIKKGKIIPYVSKKEGEKLFKKYKKSLNIVCEKPSQLAINLSGGNQQKVVFSKWLARNPKILIIDEGTAGVDINAKNAIRKIIKEQVEKGLSVIFISSEFSEITKIADRIMIMNDGEICNKIGSIEEEGELRDIVQKNIIC